MNFEKLHNFIAEEMRMSQVYQPVMLMELLKRNGQASVQQIAQAILDKDPTQIPVGWVFFSAGGHAKGKH